MVNKPNVERAYILGTRVSKWGCDKLTKEMLLVRNSEMNRVYFVEIKPSKLFLGGTFFSLLSQKERTSVTFLFLC